MWRRRQIGVTDVLTKRGTSKITSNCWCARRRVQPDFFLGAYSKEHILPRAYFQAFGLQD